MRWLLQRWPDGIRLSSLSRRYARSIHTFIGWTGKGMPKKTPVSIFHSPEKTRVVDREMELLTARAIMRGKRVPRSPSDPEISEMGDLRRTATLFACTRRILEKSIVGEMHHGRSRNKARGRER